MQLEYLNTILFHGLNKQVLKNKTGININVSQENGIPEIKRSPDQGQEELSQSVLMNPAKDIHESKLASQTNQPVSNTVHPDTNEVLENKRTLNVPISKTNNIDTYSHQNKKGLTFVHVTPEQSEASIEMFKDYSFTDNKIRRQGNLLAEYKNDKIQKSAITRKRTSERKNKQIIVEEVTRIDPVQKKTEIRVTNVKIPLLRDITNTQFIKGTTSGEKILSEEHLSLEPKAITDPRTSNLSDIKSSSANNIFSKTFVNQVHTDNNRRSSAKSELLPNSGYYSQMDTELMNELRIKQKEIKELKEKLTSLETKISNHLQKEKMSERHCLPERPISKNLGGWTYHERSYFR